MSFPNTAKRKKENQTKQNKTKKRVAAEHGCQKRLSAEIGDIVPDEDVVAVPLFLETNQTWSFHVLTGPFVFNEPFPKMKK